MVGKWWSFAIIKAMKPKWFDLQTGLEVIHFCEKVGSSKSKILLCQGSALLKSKYTTGNFM